MSGRRTRAATAKMATTPLETVDFASPKRKDCKLDMDSVPSMPNGRVTKSSPTHITSTHITNGKRNHKNATGAKSRKNAQAITKYFPSNGNTSTDAIVDDQPTMNDSIENTAPLDVDNLVATAVPTSDEPKPKVENILNTSNGDSSNSKQSNILNGSILLSPESKLQNAVKQSTPHRIVCCSSPSKKQRLYAKDPVEVFSHLNLRDGSSPKAKLSARTRRDQQKSRRKLNVNEVENSENKKVATNGLVVDVDVKPLMNGDAATVKPVLNGTVDQNANKSQEFAAPKNGTVRRVQNAQMTDYFPIRRSVRKTKKEVELEQSRLIEIAIEKQLEDGLIIKDFAEKGRGIVAGKPFGRGDFVVEYIGELIDQTEADRREEEYAKQSEFGCYMYYFKHKETQWCIDATAESGKLGRLVNHSRNGNLSTKIVSYEGKPRLVLLAKDNIKEGEELTYDYGDRRKEASIHHPWLAF